MFLSSLFGSSFLRRCAMHTSRCFVVAVVAMVVAFASDSAKAVDPGYPANIYIQNVDVASPTNPLNFNNGGMRGMRLTQRGVDLGKWWDGSWALASFAIDSWQRQTGKRWPYHWRSQESVAREFRYHCWMLGYYNMYRPITISFRG